ncbi:MAG: hypothetical protein QM541_05140 [Flavobacterium sp.]|nr:hypothetical protein [Flavobacterium sp.]
MQFEAHRLAKNQKQIILLGLGDREISSNDIFRALNINNTETETFTKEVTILRHLGILDEFRTNVSASSYVSRQKAKGKTISKKDVPRFKVKIP